MPTPSTQLPTTCLIGAGSSGITAAKALLERGIPFDCFEQSECVGGNWLFGNRNGLSAAYRSLFIDTSRERMQYPTFRCPNYPDFPHHTQILAYFDNYVDHFGLREHISFNTTVEHAQRRPDGFWEVTSTRGGAAPRTTRCSWPTAITGTRAGPSPPSRATRSPARKCTPIPTRQPIFVARTSLILGMGNSRDGYRRRVQLRRPTPTCPHGEAPGSSPSPRSAGPLISCRNDPRIPFAIRQRDIPQSIKTIMGPSPGATGCPSPITCSVSPTRPSRAHPRPARGRHDHAEADHRLAGRRPRALHRRQRARGGRPGHVLHRLQDQLPLLRSGFPRGAGQRPPAVPPCIPPGHRGSVLYRPAATAGGDDAVAEAQSEVGRPPTCAASMRCPSRRIYARRSPASGRRCTNATWPQSGTRCRLTSDDYLRDLGKERAAGAARARQRGNALPVPARAAAASGEAIPR